MIEDSIDNELQEFILTETQKQRFQVICTINALRILASD